MLKEQLYFFFLLFGCLASAQFECPTIDSPINGEMDVPVDITITWTAVEGVPSYLISLGTTPGGTDIVDSQTVGGPLFTPELGLPENTDIYVTITLFFFNQENIECPSEVFRTEDITTPPPCTNLNNPIDGSIDVAINTIISWDHAPTATGYFISMGTSPESSDLLVNLEITGSLTYEPDFELPFVSEIFISIIPFNENGTAANCQEFSFTTQAEVFLPDCTQLTSPADGEFNVPLTPLLEWDAEPEADGYRLSIGTTPSGNDIVNNAPYPVNFVEVFDFLPSRTFYITITPFNQAGDAIGCTQTSFTTLLGCGPVEIPTTGEIVSFGPEIELPDNIAICLNEDSTVITSNDIADGYRWYKINNDNTETLVSDTENLSSLEVGMYRYEVYNLVTQSGDTFECSNSKIFSVITSEIPIIENVETHESNGLVNITIFTDGIGDYEYAVDTIDGPYQSGNILNGLMEGSHTVYVRDKNGCGIAEKTIFKGLNNEGFPAFFTPNGDGINDYWQFEPPEGSDEEVIETIQIFNRFGVLLTSIEPTSNGWDGNLNGVSLPSSDYWFKAVSKNNTEVKGHFCLKR